MNDLLPHEAFLLKTITEDNYFVIVGGFCPIGKREETINCYLKLNNFKLGQFTDEYLVDYLLANAIKEVSPKWVPMVGASISIDGVKNSTGGIIGNPFEQVESSQEDIEEVINGMYLVSFPGGPGAAFTGIYSDTIMLKEKIIEYKCGKCSLKSLLNTLGEISNLYILVEDGSGFMNCGGIYISDHSGRKIETFYNN